MRLLNCMVVKHAGTGSRCPKTKAPRLVLLPHQPILLVFLYLGGWSRTPPCCLYHFLNLTSWPAAGLCLHVRNNVGFLKASDHFLDVTSLVSERVVNSVDDLRVNELFMFPCLEIFFRKQLCVDRDQWTNILVINLLPETGWSPLIRLGVGVLRLVLVGTEDVCAPPTNTAPPTKW